MGLLSNLLKKREETKEEVSTPVVDNNERGATDPESSKPAEEPVVEKPVVRAPSVLTPVTYDPGKHKPRDLAHDPDSNEKPEGSLSFM